MSQKSFSPLICSQFTKNSHFSHKKQRKKNSLNFIQFSARFRLVNMKLLIIFLLITATSSIKIKCRYSNTLILGFGDAYTCDVITMDFADNSTHITEVKRVGKHGRGKKNFDVQRISFNFYYCRDFDLKIIPKGFLNFFPNLWGFW